jgi:hypothetical protein
MEPNGQSPCLPAGRRNSCLTSCGATSHVLRRDKAVLRQPMEVSSLTAELPGNEVSFHRVPLIQRARSSPPRPKVVLAGRSSLHHAGVVCC